MFWVGFGVGSIVGCCAGFLAFSLCKMAKTHNNEES